MPAYQGKMRSLDKLQKSQFSFCFKTGFPKSLVSEPIIICKAQNFLGVNFINVFCARVKFVQAQILSRENTYVRKMREKNFHEIDHRIHSVLPINRS